jgi:hypothetical protein
MRVIPVIFLLAGAPALADDTPLKLSEPKLSFWRDLQPEDEPGEQPKLEAPKHTPRHIFGEENGQWLTLGLGVAHDFSKATDYDLRFAWSQFLIDDVEFSLEGNLWYFDQEGDNAVGINPVLLFRWHFLSEERWSVYADIGVGLMLSSSAVPEGATDFGFTPRAGVGITYQIDESAPTRLQLGFRWHHISNARVTGDAKNPARDAPMLYAGFVFPF